MLMRYCRCLIADTPQFLHRVVPFNSVSCRRSTSSSNGVTTLRSSSRCPTQTFARSSATKTWSSSWRRTRSFSICASFVLYEELAQYWPYWCGSEFFILKIVQRFHFVLGVRLRLPIATPQRKCGAHSSHLQWGVRTMLNRRNGVWRTFNHELYVKGVRDGKEEIRCPRNV